MFSKTIIFAFAMLTHVMVSSACAGKVELTTYYPAPFGEYDKLQSNESVSGKAAVGDFNNDGHVNNADLATANVPDGGLAVKSSVKIGEDLTDCTAVNEGAMRYNSTTTPKRMEYCDGDGTWQPIGSGTGVADQSLNENGYIEFDNGLIIQWGVVHNAAHGVVQTVTFPTAFPNACWAGFVAHGTSQYWSYQADTSFVKVGNTQAKMVQTGTGTRDLYWLAIGN